MKSKPLILMMALASCVSLRSFAQSNPDLTVTASSLGVVFDYTSFTGGPDGNGNGTSAGLNVGAYVPGGSNPNQLLRGWLTFSLASFSADIDQVDSIYLQVDLTGGTGRKGDINLYYSDAASSATYDKTRYEDTSFVNTGDVVGTTAGIYLIDVTQLVKESIAGGSVVASFRLQNDSIDTPTEYATYNIATFSTSTANKPQLLITYAPIPEPASAALALGAAGLACVLATRRRRW